MKLVPTSFFSSGPGLLTRLATTMALILSAASTTVHAEVALKGTVDAVEIEARDSSIAEILTRLGSAFDLQYRTSVDLNRPVTGTFSGPVLGVMSRLLKDYDYIVKNSADEKIKVIVVKLSSKESEKIISVPKLPYPDPLWQARSYSRTFHPNPPPRQDR